MLTARNTWWCVLREKCPGHVQPDQSEIDRMVQETENNRDEDEANMSKDEDENGLENVEKFEYGDGHKAVYNCDAGYVPSEDKTTFETHCEAIVHFPPSSSAEILTNAVCAAC